jgi:hypothetical protein
MSTDRNSGSWKAWLKQGKIGGESGKQADAGYSQGSASSRVEGAQTVVKRGSVANLANAFGGSVTPKRAKSLVFDSNTDGYGNTKRPSIGASAGRDSGERAAVAHSRSSSLESTAGSSTPIVHSRSSSSPANAGSDIADQSGEGNSIQLIQQACIRQAALAERLHNKEVIPLDQLHTHGADALFSWFRLW